MTFLYSGDSFGTVKEYDILKILSLDCDLRNLTTKTLNEDIRRVTFISSKKNSTSIRENKGNLNSKLCNEIFIGYSDGTIEFFSVPFQNDFLIPKIKFKISGEIIFIEDVSNNYSNETQDGSTVILAITNLMQLYLLKEPSVDKNSQKSLFINLCNSSDDSELFSKYIVNTIKLPSENIKCIAYNESKNSIAFGGYESDVKIMNLDTFSISWRCKNVQANSLKHRIPIDVSKLVFLRENPEVILCGTGFGEIRIYAPISQKRPLINYGLWEEKLPITDIAVVKYWSKYKSDKNVDGCIFVVGNNKGSALLIKVSHITVEKKKIIVPTEHKESALIKKKKKQSLQKFFSANPFNKLNNSKLNESSNLGYKIEVSVLGSFRGIIGGITSMNYIKVRGSEKLFDHFLVISGPGRYLYIFDVKKRRLVKKIFNSQKTSFVLLCDM